MRFPRKASRKRRPDPGALELLLDALDVKIIPTNKTRADNETTARGTLQRLLDQQGAEHLRIVLRAIVESEGNARALIDPVIMAVSAVALAYPAWPATGLAWIELYDGLDLFAMHQIVRPLKPDDKARSMIAGMLVARLHPVFCPPKAKRAKAEKPPKPPTGARKAIEQGLELLKYKGPHANSPIGRNRGRNGPAAIAPGQRTDSGRAALWQSDQTRRGAYVRGPVCSDEQPVAAGHQGRIRGPAC